MTAEVKIPSVGESIVMVKILSWLVTDGSRVEEGQSLLELETEKATMTVQSESAGIIRILVPADQEIRVGTLVATLESPAAGHPPVIATLPVENATVAAPATYGPSGAKGEIASPAASKLLREHGMTNKDISITSGKEGRITKGDVLSALENRPVPVDPPPMSQPILPPPVPVVSKTVKSPRAGEKRVRMSMLRQSLSKRLVAVKNETAMLTTFNEVDLSSVQEIRRTDGEAFLAEHGVKLGFMSFFIRAAALALKEFPEANACIDGSEIIYHDFIDIGIAVSTERGLMVPVLRNADRLNLAQLEKSIAVLAEKARNKSLSIEEMEGGTFTITNGGVFGSLLSTPILNPPQAAILGMHTLQDRPVAREGQVVIRPMMYVALSYDHRLLDGKESVGFLKKIKEHIESAETLR